MAEAVLELDIGPALEALDSLSDAFDSIVSGLGNEIASALSNATVGSLADVLLPEIDEVGAALSSVTDGFGEGLSGAISDQLLPQIDDVSGALGAVGSDFNQSFDTTSITGATDDIGDLSEGLDTLEAAVGRTSSGMDLLNTATGGVQAAAGVLEGTSGALIHTIVPEAAIFGGITAAIGGLVEKADAATQSKEQMDRVFGSEAPKVFHSELEGLNLNLDQLNTKAGGSNVALQAQITTLGQTAIGMGATKQEAAQVTARMGELAAIVTTLKPALGTASDNFTLLTRGLGGSTRILQRYGISIDKAAQSHLALELAQEHGRTAAQLYDKQVAGSILALQALQKQATDSGTTLQQQIDKGLDSSTIKFRRFKQEIETTLVTIGAPLVKPVLEIAEALTPVFVKLTESVGKILAAVLPAIVPLAEAFADVVSAVEPVLDLFTKIPKPVFEIVAAFFALRSGMGLFNKLFGGVLGNLTNLISGFGRTADASQVAASNFTKLGTEAGRGAGGVKDLGAVFTTAAVGIGIGIGSMHDFGVTTEGTIGTIGGFTAAGASLGSVIPGVGTALGAFLGAVGGLTAGLITGGESVKDYEAHFTKLADTITKSGLTGEKAFKAFLDTLGSTDRAQLGIAGVSHTIAQLSIDVLGFHKSLTQLSAANIKAVVDEIRTMGTESPAAAREVVAYFNVLKNGKGQLALTQQAQNALNRALEKGEQAHATAKIIAEQYAASNAQIEAAVQANTIAQNEGVQAAIRFVTAERELSDETGVLVKQFGNVGGSFDSAFAKAGEISKVFGDGTVDIGSFSKALEITGDQAAKFSGNLKILIDNGLGVLAGEIASKGPEAGGKLAQQIADGLTGGSPDIAKAAADSMQDAVIALQARSIVIQEAIANIFGKNIASQFTEKFRAAKEAVAEELGLTFITLQNGNQKLVTQEQAAAVALGAAYVESLQKANIPGVTQEQIDAAISGLDKSDNATKAGAAGTKHGKAYGGNYATAITSTAPDVQAAATKLVPTGGVGAKEAGHEIGVRFGSSLAEGIGGQSGAVHDAATAVIPTGGIGAENWGHTIGVRYGTSLGEGITSQDGSIHEAARSVIPTGGLGAEDWGHTIGVRYGSSIAEGISSQGGVIAAAAQDVIPTGGLGARDAGEIIGERFDEGLAAGMANNSSVVEAAARAVVLNAIFAAEHAGSPSVHLWHDAGYSFAQALSAGLVAGTPELQSTAQSLVTTVVDAMSPLMDVLASPEWKAWSAAGFPSLSPSSVASISSGVVNEDSPDWQWWSMGNKTAGVDYAATHPAPEGTQISDPYINDYGAWVVSAFQRGGFTDWPQDQGRIAILHGQEAILNKAQLEALLSTVAARAITSALRDPGEAGRAVAASHGGNVTVDRSQTFERGAIEISMPSPDPRAVSLELSRRLRADAALRYR